jgi:cell wall-associated NlpC family hydrolase
MQPAASLPVQPAALVVPRPVTQADSIVTYALQQLGSPYTYAGTTPHDGFDCSGFVMYVYGHFDIAMPHSTAQLISVGRAVPRQQARKGDIVVFTGTAASTTPGHAGIVISDPGEPIRFVHASSARRESGVKISEVAGTDYERRFMGVRRVL